MMPEQSMHYAGAYIYSVHHNGSVITLRLQEPFNSICDFL